MKKSKIIIILLLCVVAIGIAGLSFYNPKPPKYYIEPARDARLLRYGYENKTPEVEQRVDNFFYQYCSDYTSDTCDPYYIHEWILAELVLNRTKADLIQKFDIDKVLYYKYYRYYNNSFTPDFSWRQVHFTLLSMDLLNMLSPSERIYWVNKYTEFPANPNETHKERQVNLIVKLLNFSNIENLSTIPEINMDVARKNVCSPMLVLTTQDDPCAADNYLFFKSFCNYEITQKDRDTVNEIINRKYTSIDAQVFQICINYIIRNNYYVKK